MQDMLEIFPLKKKPFSLHCNILHQKAKSNLAKKLSNSIECT